MNDWDDTLQRLHHQWGPRLDLTDIADRFLPFFHGPRIRVDLGAWQPLTGRVGITTGYRPSLLLLRRTDGEPWLIRDENALIGVNVGGRYLPPSDPQVISLYARYAATHGGIL